MLKGLTADEECGVSLEGVARVVCMPPTDFMHIIQ